MIKKLPLILMMINAFLAPDGVSFVARVCGATVKLNQHGAGGQKQATSRTPRLFTSTNVQVQIAGYWWPDTLPLLLGPKMQNLPANRGDKWLAILCKVTPKGTQESRDGYQSGPLRSRSVA